MEGRKADGRMHGCEWRPGWREEGGVEGGKQRRKREGWGEAWKEKNRRWVRDILMEEWEPMMQTVQMDLEPEGLGLMGPKSALF